MNASEFRHQVSAICESGDALIEARVTQALESGATAEVASAVLIDTVIPTVENEIAQAEALHGPEELEHGVRTMTASVRVQLDRLREIAASPDPLAGFVGDPFAEAHALAAQLGFAGCRYAER